MGRYTFPSWSKPLRRYVVLWDLQWHALACQRLEPATDLSGAMAAAIDRFANVEQRSVLKNHKLLFTSIFARYEYSATSDVHNYVLVNAVGGRSSLSRNRISNGF
jgi:hypothetical protein